MRHFFLVLSFLLCQIHAALADEVPCDDISITFSADDFNQRCENRRATGQASFQVHVLDATSSDNRRFLFAISRITRQGFYFMMPDFKEAVTGGFSFLRIENWSEGKEVEGYKVAEFSGMVSGIESLCLAFQGRGIRSPGGGGYSRYSMGVTCTVEKSDRDGLYGLLQQLDM